MPHSDALRWNARYVTAREKWLQKKPRPLLRAHANLLPESGLVLDGGGGAGANALFLAARGLRVVVLDISLSGLRLAHARARQLGLTLHAAVVDLARVWLPSEHFDVILNFMFLERAALHAYRRALKPGGVLFCETFRRTRPEQPYYFLEAGELRATFEDFEVLHWKQNVPYGDKVSEQLIIRKP